MQFSNATIYVHDVTAPMLKGGPNVNRLSTHLLNIIESEYLQFAHIAYSQCTSDTVNGFTKVVTCKFDNFVPFPRRP